MCNPFVLLWAGPLATAKMRAVICLTKGAFARRARPRWLTGVVGLKVDKCISSVDTVGLFSDSELARDEIIMKFVLLSRTFEHACLDTCCLGRLVCTCFVFWYLQLFIAVEHLSHRKAL